MNRAREKQVRYRKSRLEQCRSFSTLLKCVRHFLFLTITLPFSLKGFWMCLLASMSMPIAITVLKSKVGSIYFYIFISWDGVRVAQSPLFLFTPTFLAIVLRLGDWAETAWIVISLLNSGNFM